MREKCEITQDGGGDRIDIGRKLKRCEDREKTRRGRRGREVIT